MIKEYIEYLKDNPNGYWFKTKLYGWGWVPAKWQGRVTTVIYILAIVFFVVIRKNDLSTDNKTSGFALYVILLTAVLLFICYKKGEKPKWRWGITKK